MSQKSKWVTLVLCVGFGWLGLHRFYLGKIVTGIIYFLTMGLFGIGILFDFIMLILGRTKDGKRLPVEPFFTHTTVAISESIPVNTDPDLANESVVAQVSSAVEDKPQNIGFIAKIKDYFHRRSVKRAGAREYGEKLGTFLGNGTYSEENKAELATIADKYGITKEELKPAYKNAIKALAKVFKETHLVSDDQLGIIVSLASEYNLTDYMHKKTNNKLYDYHVLWQIQEKGILPTEDWSGVSIIPKTDEVLHWSDFGRIIKIKNVTKRVNYRGPTASIKIAKGIRYRIGSVSVGKTTERVAEQVDAGTFWISNQRVGFIGDSKSFTVPLNKIVSFGVDGDVGLKIFKEGAVNPKTVVLNDYDVAGTIISYLVNR